MQILRSKHLSCNNSYQIYFFRGGFLLDKWNSDNPIVLQHIAPKLKEYQVLHIITEAETYTKTLGIEWNSNSEPFRLTIADLPPLTSITKRLLVSDIAKTFDVLGWFSPAIIEVKYSYKDSGS